MTHEQLKAFIAVVANGSFRSAAKAIHKTQSTVSDSIKKLEDELGIQLLDRGKYRPVLTDQGKAFFEQARRVVSQFDRLDAYGKYLAAGDDPSLTIVLSGICALPPILETLRDNIRAFPQTKFAITTEHMSGVLEKLNGQGANLAIGPSIGIDHRHEYAQIGTVTIMTVAAAGFAPSNAPPQSQASMRKHAHILVSDSGIKDPKAHVNVIPGGTCWYVNDYACKKALIMAGLGWGRLPIHMIKQELTSGLLQPIQIEGIHNQQKVPIFIIRSLEQTPGPVAEHLWEQFCAADGWE
jgi:DNA-binding transcriptional LysR family regulator